MHIHHGLFFSGGKEHENIFSGNDGDHILLGCGDSLLIVCPWKNACGHGTSGLSEAAARRIVSVG